MSNIIPIGQAKAPAKMRERLQAGVALNNNLSEGVRDAFPLLSIKGKVFRIRVNGQETPLIDQQTRQVIPYLDVVIINGSRTLSKAYYEKGFTEGDFDAPLCWSLDSVRPDPSVANKVNPTCADCPKNIFGSRITDAGKQAKACQDARRVAVVMPGHLGTPDPMVFMLRVPQSSLKNLKAYAQNLERQGWEPAGCVTRLAFDYQEAYPKLVFNFVDGLNDLEYQQTVELAESPSTASMLSAPETDGSVSTTPAAENPNVERRVRQEAPVMENPELVDRRVPEGDPDPVPMKRPVAREEPVVFKPQPKAVPTEELIELPDGQLFNPATGEYIERPKPKVEMPSMDPDTIVLPDGRFFNKKLNAFVAGQEVGAKPATVEEPVKRRPRGPKAKVVPTEPEVTEPEQEPAPQPAPPAEKKGRHQQIEGAAPTVAEVKGAFRQALEEDPQEAEEQPVDNGQNAEEHVQPGIKAAPVGLEAILKSVMPTRK